MPPGLILAVLLGLAVAAPAPVSDNVELFPTASPGGIGDIVMTKENTLNGTYHGDETTIVQVKAARGAEYAASGSLPLRFVNKLGGGKINAYIQGLDSQNRIVFVKRDGTLVYPSSGGSTIPVPVRESIAIPLSGKDSVLSMTLPIALISGRVYFAEGDLQFFMVKTPVGDGLVQPSAANNRDPSSGINWGFVEMTYTRNRSLYANISYVDFVGMILSLGLKAKNSMNAQITRGLAGGSVAKICSALLEQSMKDKYPWKDLCVATQGGKLIRVLSPNIYSTTKPEQFSNYWNNYIDESWKRYAENKLTIDTQSNSGQVQCRVIGDVLKCGGGDNRGYAKPTSGDIWGCNSGPFERRGGDNAVHVAVIPRLCAAFVRSTLMLAGGGIQPWLKSSYYYLSETTHHYSRLVHKFEVDGKGYAFPYDDVNPTGVPDASGMVSSDSPELLTIYIGSPPP